MPLLTNLFLLVNSQYLMIIEPLLTKVSDPGQRWYFTVLKTCEVEAQATYIMQSIPGTRNMISILSASSQSGNVGNFVECFQRSFAPQVNCTPVRTVQGGVDGEV